MAGKRPLLSLVMIMRDAAEDLEKCLASCAEAVDEMIICDTGSRDDSVRIARRFLREWQGEKSPRKRRGKLLHYEWQDDFAAARNFALEQAKGQWALTMDADEWLTEETRGNLRPLIETIVAGRLPEGVQILGQNPDQNAPCERLEIWRYNLNQKDEPYLEAKRVDWAPRLMLIAPGLRYEGEVHEQQRWDDGRMARTGAISKELLAIVHTGYLENVDPLKIERNNKILLKEEKEGGHTQLKHYYLAEIYWEKQDYLSVARHAEAAIKGNCPLHDMFWPWRTLYRACVKLEQEAIEKHGKGSKEALFAEEQTEKTLVAGIQRMADYPEFYYYRGVRLLEAGEREKGLEHLRLCAKLERVFPEYHPGQERHYEKLLPDLYRRLVTLCEEQGEQEEAAAARERLAALEQGSTGIDGKGEVGT